MRDIEAYAKKTKNVVYLPKRADLNTVLEHSLAVAGVNSTVLTEARLMFNKPVYAYAESWFTNHTELICPLKLKTVCFTDDRNEPEEQGSSLCRDVGGRIPIG